jgi:hypothetical protein
VIIFDKTLEIDGYRFEPEYLCYYVQAFLESKVGEITLNQCTLNGTIMSLSIKAIEGIEIPILAGNDMLEVVDTYLDKQMEISKLKRKLLELKKEKQVAINGKF